MHRQHFTPGLGRKPCIDTQYCSQLLFTYYFLFDIIFLIFVQCNIQLLMARLGKQPSFYRVEEIVGEYEGDPLQHSHQQLLHAATVRKYFYMVNKYITRMSGFSPMRVSAWPKRGPVAVNRDLGWNIWYSVSLGIQDERGNFFSIYIN